ncbi:hypothetical protein ACW4FP_19955 (plasmid) [Paenarthrobacter ureafaciens]
MQMLTAPRNAIPPTHKGETRPVSDHILEHKRVSTLSSIIIHRISASEPGHFTAAETSRPQASVSVSTRRELFLFQYRGEEVSGGSFSFRGAGRSSISLLQGRQVSRPDHSNEVGAASAAVVQRTGMMAPTTRTGRRSKGDRKFVGFRIATPKADAMEEIAKAEGYQYVSDWLSDVVEERLANTRLHAIVQQEELPLGRLAS